MGASSPRALSSTPSGGEGVRPDFCICRPDAGSAVAKNGIARSIQLSKIDPLILPVPIRAKVVWKESIDWGKTDNFCRMLAEKSDGRKNLAEAITVLIKPL
jgi:hypothetical protein